MRFSIILVLIATACQGGFRADLAEVRETIESKNANLERWYAEGKIDSAAMVFAEDTWQMLPNAAPLVGRDAYRGFWTQAVQWGHWRFDLEVQDVVVVDSIAVERGKYTLDFEAGSEAPIPSSEDRGNYVVLWRLDPDGEWRVVWDAPVSELSPAGIAP